MKPHPVLRIDLVSAMLVVPSSPGNIIRAPRLPKAPRSGNTRLSVAVSAAPAKVAHINKLGDEGWRSSL